MCWTLCELIRLPEWGEHITFKGGTSLSKAWKLIERFSEDIDLVIDREFLGFGGETLSGNQQRHLKEECSRRIHVDIAPALQARFRELLPAGSAWTLEAASEAEDRDRQTLLFTYPTVFATPSTSLRGVVKLEMGARSQTIPFAMASIQPYVAEAISEVIADGTFQVRTVAARRTFWEKALLLHEETYRLKAPGQPVRAHVVEHRQVFFRYNWIDYTTMRRGSLRLLPFDEQLAAWRQDYDAMRAEMFFGEAPAFDVLLEDVGEFARRFNADGRVEKP